VQKKYRHAKKALTAGRDSNELTKKEKIPYPTRETPGRGDFNLSAFLSESSGVSKENYNSFIVCNFTVLKSTHQCSVYSADPHTPAGINP